MKVFVDCDVLIFAPHCRFPALNGADVLIEGRASGISEYVRSVVVVAENSCVVYKQGAVSEVKIFSNKIRSKKSAAIRTLIFGSHYFHEKFWTKNYETQVKFLLNIYPNCVVISSFPAISLAVNRLLKKSSYVSRSQWVETHNFEFQWFENFLNKSGFFQKLVARQSYRWLEVNLKEVLAFPAIHVSSNDAESYQKYLPHRSIVWVPGVSLPERTDFVIPTQKIELIFLGSLSVQMNVDALEFFSRTYFPFLKENFGEKLRFRVVGSSPTSRVLDLCAQNEWEIFPNLDDLKLGVLLKSSDFLVMPFEYTAGSKLKVLKALSYGLPVIGTDPSLSSGVENLPYPCMFSYSKEDWLHHLVEYKSRHDSIFLKERLIEIASNFAWGKMACEFVPIICEKIKRN